MPRFLCDEMLHGLGRWLRAAGYDTVIAESGIPDRELVRRCAGEDRILLTKDRHLATAAGIAPVVLVKGKSIDETARVLRTALDIDWQHAPFTRCLVDNALLAAAEPHDAVFVGIDVDAREAARVVLGQVGFYLRRDGRIFHEGLRVMRPAATAALGIGHRPSRTSPPVNGRAGLGSPRCG